MEKFPIPAGDEKVNPAEDKELLEFEGTRIAVYRAPHGGAERIGSIGTDFSIYLASDGKLVLVVEHWSRRPGGEDSLFCQAFDSFEELERCLVHEDFYDVEIPPLLLYKAKMALKPGKFIELRV